jgi:hypothetical protein
MQGVHTRDAVCMFSSCTVLNAAAVHCAGFYIIPRSPTEVYYDVSTEAVEAQLYNWFYCCNTTSNSACPTSAAPPCNTPMATAAPSCSSCRAQCTPQLPVSWRPSSQHQLSICACADGCEAGKPFTKPSTWADILAREQTRVMRLMLALRPDGHMFHQVMRIQLGFS